MTGKERVAKTLRGEIPDRIPRGELVIDRGFIEKYTGKSPVTLKTELSFYQEAGLDLACFSREKPLAYFAAHSSLFLFGLINGGLGDAVTELGFSEAMLKIASRPEEVRKMVEKNCRLNEEKGKRLVEAGAQALIIGDDIAYNHGTYTSVKTLKEVLFPSLKGQVAALKREGVPVFFHSDGNYTAVLDELASCGFSGLQCLEEGAGMGIAAIRQKLPPPFCLMGGLDLSYVSPDYPPAALAEKIAALMAEGKAGGSYIFGTNGGLSANLDPAAAACMFRCSQEYAAIS